MSCCDMEIIGCGCQYVIASMHNSNKMYVWGSNSNGQLGLGYACRNIDVNILTLSTKSSIRTISCGGSHTFVLTMEDECYGWGSNRYGQLGSGDHSRILSPRKLPWISGCLDISCGDNHSIFLFKSGRLWSCGSNNFGQLGIANDMDQNTIHVVYLYTINIISISCGKFHSLAVTKDGLFVWGYNAHGQLGLSNCHKMCMACRLVLGGGEFIISAKCGAFHTISLTNMDLFMFGVQILMES